jgi:DNA polymerase-1
MVRTGRTSCSGPNIQQVPRKGGFREIFVAPAGHGVLAADYSFIELRTLAAECEARYGNSKLADVIRTGVDPHCYTAAMLLGVSPEEFMALEHADPERFERQRQQAKPLNFGIPGGLGVASLVHYARSTYGVDLSEAQANSTAEADSQLT